jgi:transposase
MLLEFHLKCWLSKTPTDMRKAINGRSQLVLEQFNVSPKNGAVFIFYNRNKDKTKILFWHFNGFCLLYKRLEKDLLKIPKDLSTPLELNHQQLNRLLEGLHFITETQNRYDTFY